MNRERFLDLILLKNWRRKLTPKQVALFKLVVWCCLVVWMGFFATYAVIWTKIMGNYIPQIVEDIVGNGGGWQLWQTNIATIIPYLFLFTVLLTIYIIARYSYRKLRGKPSKLTQVLNKETINEVNDETSPRSTD